MRAVFIEKSGAPDVLRVREVPAPVPAAGQVAIAVRAAGINFADILARQGIYPPAPPTPCVVGYEVAGVVSSVGDGVDAAWLGRKVIAMPHFGGYAEVAVVDLTHVWDLPAGLSFEEAAAIPENYVTAWALLIGLGGLKPGETVLVHNAGGGVGLAAIDIARHLGARVIGTASPRKHAFLRERGCAECVDYTRGDWPEAVRKFAGGGVDLAIDPIGGAHWKKSYGVLAKGGRLGMFGISGAAGRGLAAKLGLVKLVLSMPLFHPLQLMSGNRGAFGVQMHEMYHETVKFRAWMDAVLAGVSAGWVRPHIDKVFSFDEAGAAHAHIEGRKNTGKVILIP
ncbi:MAG TPA: zinc-binding dehydrogenase [Verrucomicrobiae bacterium]|nr:zinc-binding dehydrogenase [Verrucomicrobiae bacterium]